MKPEPPAVDLESLSSTSMNSSRKPLSNLDTALSSQRMSAGEVLLLGSSLISLVVCCILWSPHKQPWMDEIFTWKEVSDPSLLHLYHAIQNGADGGMPAFYTTAWVWARIFGTSVLTLRLYSCAAMCGGLLITWNTIRRFYGMWATAFGVLMMWGTSALLLYQNVEARFYGLYVLAVAITVNMYARLMQNEEASSGTWFLILTLLCQAGLVLSHVFGLIYGILILMALVLYDATKHNLRWKVYLFYAIGWLSLLAWIPAIRNSMAAGKPNPWIQLPTIRSLFTTYLFEDFFQFSWWLKSHSHIELFKIVLRGTELIVFVPLAVVFLLCVRRLFARERRTSSDPKGGFLLVAYFLLAAPVVLFALSYLITPVFVPRYLIPSEIGMAIVLAAFADALGADSQNASRRVPRWVWPVIAVFLMGLPVFSVLALPRPEMDTFYLDVQRLENVAPPQLPVVATWLDDFTKIMRTGRDPETRYYFLLDWPSALRGPNGQVLDYHLMQAYRDNGYYSKNIQDSSNFLCSHTDFLVLNTDEPTWFNLTIRTRPQFEWKVLDSFKAPGVDRDLILVHRKASLAFCNHP
jgi:hypothetical protein